ncbi:MAG TPA: amino acid permease [Candidatus Dormibacteraeota bacterium]|jgi:APA family basic amino acid/polyamine antiporter|nr:amino acid permease [Candidatus Dormibacteraeota bacterium]
MTTLVRTIRLRDLLYLFVGSVIGSGIFIAPGLILRQVHGSVGLSLLVWIVGGVLSLLGALTYAELAAANPEAGGLYCYIRDGFGALPAFLYGWCLFVVIASGTIAALARAFTKYLNEIVQLSPWQANAASILMIAVVTAVNVWGTRESSNLQNVTTAIKAGLVVVLSAALFSVGHHGADMLSAVKTDLHGFSLLSSFGLAMIAALWAYEGWQFGTYSAGEVVEPERAFPKAFLLGSLLFIGLYLIAVFAYLVAIGPTAAAATDAIAATAAKAVLGEWAGKFVAATILISVFSSTNSVILTAPRVFYAMAKDEVFFKKLAEVHPKFHTPAAAVISLGVLAAILTQAGKFSELVEGVIFVGWIFYGLAGAAIFPLRRKYANRAFPYRVPGYPWTPIIFVLAAVAIVGNAIYRATIDPTQFRHVLAALALLAAGVPVYFFWRWRKRTA